ncbi:hypothetical protein PhCBS80983_g03384 [Powellomyces hirtus]|uniref:Uncharacterized protein n=1 Tax=Powellomyces hirtus TaxID=109895 RepID=A0A507E4K8_9FUNG|nr:hypothetical protein PhCBS80983_g03384 [Powellomyces hirtus]
MEQPEMRITRAAAAGQKPKMVDGKVVKTAALSTKPRLEEKKQNVMVPMKNQGLGALDKGGLKKAPLKVKKDIKVFADKPNVETKRVLVKASQNAPLKERAVKKDLARPEVKAVNKVVKKAVNKETIVLRENKEANAAVRQEQLLQEEVMLKAIRKAPAEDRDANKENRAAASISVVPKHVRNDAGEALPVAKKAKTDPVLEEITTWEDLDADDHNDPMMVAEYVDDIFEYLLKLEEITMPNPNYIDIQEGLAWSMRSILIDWLIELSNHFRLLPETLYMAVNIIDRFLTDRPVSMNKLQLVGLASLFIASKYEEVNAPSVHSIVFFGDGGFDAEDIMKAERYILQILKFELHYPSPMSFLRRCSKADAYDIQTRTIAKYLMEISIVDHRFLAVKPSLTAASGLYLARRMLERGPWDAGLIHYSGYTEEQIIPVSELMIEYLIRPKKTMALYKKYASRKFMKASVIVEDWLAYHSDPAGEESDF